MKQEDVYIIQPDKIYLAALRTSTLITRFVILDLSTDFSRLVYNSNLIVFDDLLLLNERLKKTEVGEDIGFNEEEFVLLYMQLYSILFCSKQRSVL